MVSDRVDELFPRTFSYESGGAATTLPLFGDLVEAVTRLVDSESAGDAPPDLVPATGAEIWSLGEIQFGRGISASWPRRRRDLPPRNNTSIHRY